MEKEVFRRGLHVVSISFGGPRGSSDSRPIERICTWAAATWWRCSSTTIYDLGDGNIDFPACHRVLKEIAYKGCICVDLDTARKGPKASYERSGAYIVKRLEPIYS
jgi:hypothetical protein